MISIMWRCDKCKKQLVKKYAYRWDQGLGDIWHPKTFRGFKNELLCSKCYKVAERKFWKENPDAVLTA